MKKAIVAIVAQWDEPYLKEWLKWHFDLGFDAAYLYLNNWTDKTLLAKVKDTDFGKEVHFRIFDGDVMQLKAYNDFLTFKSDVDWAAFIDVDEFLKIRYPESLEFILSGFQNVPALAVNWRLHGSNGHKTNDAEFEDGVVKTFPMCEKTLNKHVKQILNIRFIQKNTPYVRFMNPHFINIASVSITGYYFEGPFSNFDLDKVHRLELSHYITKSEQSCRERRSSPRADTGKAREEGWEKFFKDYDKNEIDEQYLVSK